MSRQPKEPSMFRRLLDLSLPIIGLNVLSVITLAVDTAMCGRLVNAEDALTALSFASQIVFLLMVAMLGLTVGNVAIVARAHGALQTERVNHVLHQSTLLAYLVSVGVAILGNLFAGPIMGLLGAEDAVREIGVQYLRPLLTFTIFYYLNMLLAATLRGVGNTTLPFFVAVIGNALNIVLNYALIFGKLGAPALGVRGAAWGTVVAQAFSVALLIYFLKRDLIPGVRAKLAWTKLDVPLAKDLFRVGWPAALDMVILNVAFLSIVGMLAAIAQVSVAAHGVGLRIQSLAFVPGLAVSQAISAMVGNALGANDVAEAREVVRAGVLICSVMMSAIGLGIVFGAVPIIAIFDVSPDTALGQYALTWMRILGWGMPAVGVHIALIGMLRGSGATNTSLVINIIGTVIVQVPLSYILGFVAEMGAFGVWVALPVSFVIRMFLGIAAYQRGRWATLGSSV